MASQECEADIYLTKFEEAERASRFAAAWGIETDELSHNHMLHWLLERRDFGSALAKELWIHSGGTGACVELVRPRFQPALPSNKQGDELLELSVDGEQRQLLIEIKLKDRKGEGQLESYLQKAQGAGPPIRGLLLRLAGTPMTPFESQNAECAVGLDWLNLVKRAAKKASGNLEEMDRRIVEDYLKTLRWLIAREDLVINASSVFNNKRINRRLVQNWRNRDWRWIQERIVIEAGRRLRKQGPSNVGSFGVTFNDDANGSSVDFWLPGPRGYPNSNIKPFLKWRLKKGLEVHIGAWGCEKPPEIVRAFRADTRPALLELWSGAKTKISNRLGNSGMILRLVNETFDIDEMTGIIRDQAPKVYECIKSAVDDLGHSTAP